MKLKNKFLFGLLTLFCCALIFSSCQRSEKIHVVRKPAKKITPEPGMTTPFWAGAAKVDITPPPGYPMAGYAISGKFSRGWWCRLYAKSIYIQDHAGNRIVLVSCDLNSIPEGLTDRVVEIVDQRIASSHPDSSFLGKEQVILAATHTHNGPGNFYTSAAYNMLYTAESGFDAKLFHFLADRIASSIVEAVESKKAATIKKAAIDLPGLIRNRSLDAFERNLESEKDAILRRVSLEKTDSLFTYSPAAFVTSPNALRAIDPKLTVLKFEEESAQPVTIAVAAFYAVHPTAMGPKTEVYSSDIFGVASTLVERHLSSYQASGNPVVAIFNGAEGDVSPNWDNRGRDNTLDIGQKLAAGILTALNKATQAISGEISYRYQVVKMASRKVEDRHGDVASLCISENQPRTAEKPLPGVATLGGAEDGRTFFYNLGFREGYVTNECHPQHGYKLFSADIFLDKLFPKEEKPLLREFVRNLTNEIVKLPEEVPLGVYAIGSIVLAALPGEFTVALGNRIHNTLRTATDAEIVLLVGLANGYLVYFTTPLEYNAQHYEGASTMYGQMSGVYVEQELERIAKLPKNIADYKLEKTYISGAKAAEKFGKLPQREPWHLSEALENILQDIASGPTRRNFPQFAWWDKPVFLQDAEKRGDSKATIRVNPIVSIEYKKDAGWEPLKYSTDNAQIAFVESDTTSVNFVTVVESVPSDTLYRWRTIWLVPSHADYTQNVRFHVKTANGKTIYSDAFLTGEVLSGEKPSAIK